MANGGPYPQGTWQLGGAPTKGTDIPITAVYLALYILGAITHMTIFQKNRRRGHKFLFSVFLFGFCMARTVTCIVRIASISLSDNVRLSIAAAIFVAAGVVALFVINLLFAQRIVRAQHPRWGWHPLFKAFCTAVYVIIVLTLIMLITTVVQSYYTLSTNTHRIDRDVQIYGATMYAAIAFLPLALLGLSLALPRRNPAAVDKFGAGRFRTKIAVLAAASTLICAGACWRAGTTWAMPVPKDQAVPWFHQKVYFYVFDFTVEIITVYLYALVRVDLRFFIPNGAHGPRSYRAGAAAAPPDADAEQQQQAGAGGLHVYTEEETFELDDGAAAAGAKSAEKDDVESRPASAETQLRPPQTASTLAPEVAPLHTYDEKPN